jgi:hypothetical protein
MMADGLWPLGGLIQVVLRPIGRRQPFAALVERLRRVNAKLSSEEIKFASVE